MILDKRVTKYKIHKPDVPTSTGVSFVSVPSRVSSRLEIGGASPSMGSRHQGFHTGHLETPGSMERVPRNFIFDKNIIKIL